MEVVNAVNNNLDKYNSIIRELQNKSSIIIIELKKLSNKEYIDKAYKESLELIENETKDYLEILNIFEKEKQYAKREKLLKKTLSFGLKKLNEKEQLPTKEEFIKKCGKIYITWDDIKFETNKILISPNKAFVQPIIIDGSLKILNEIKAEYFQRVYKNEIYKLFIKDGIVREDLSRDLEKIRTLINDRINEIEVKVKFNGITSKEKLEENMTKDQILKYLKKNKIKNEYLKYPASIMRADDRVRALIEINNEAEEECLLFIFKNNISDIMLWENLNSDRAAYFFVVDKENAKDTLIKIIKFIKADLKYKRENLFQGIDINKIYKLNCRTYRSIIHLENRDYKKKIDKILIR
jgi:hypothetical protein